LDFDLLVFGTNQLKPPTLLPQFESSARSEPDWQQRPTLNNEKCDGHRPPLQKKLSITSREK